MFFADVPQEDPEMFIEKDTLEVGYTLRGNCTSPPSYPYANITWFLNGKRVSTHFILPSREELLSQQRVYRVSPPKSFVMVN